MCAISWDIHSKLPCEISNIKAKHNMKKKKTTNHYIKVGQTTT